LLENHHPSLSPIPGSPAHFSSNGSVNGNNDNTVSNNNSTQAASSSSAPTFDNLIHLARNFHSNHQNSSSNNKNCESGLQNSPSHLNSYSDHQLKYATIANRIANHRPNQNINLGLPVYANYYTSTNATNTFGNINLNLAQRRQQNADNFKNYTLQYSQASSNYSSFSRNNDNARNATTPALNGTKEHVNEKEKVPLNGHTNCNKNSTNTVSNFLETLTA